MREATGDATYNDVNYVFPTFITTHMPIGLVGLLIAAIFAAAMSTISGGAGGAVDSDGHRLLPPLLRPVADDRALPARVAAGDGVLGAVRERGGRWAAELGSLIEVVNRFGSYFYGSILGVFILAIGFPRATPTAPSSG